MMRKHSFAALALTAVVTTALALGCSDTNAPLPDPEEVLLAVNSTANTLSIVPVEAPNSAVAVPLGGTTPTPTGVSAREGVAIVPLGLDNAVAVVDLRTATVLRTIPLPENSGATGSAIVDDSIAYVGNPNINTVSRINYITGATSEVPAGVYPSGLIFTRGKVFVINANLDETFSPAGPSWLTVIDPTISAAAPAIDSIALTGEGNASFAAVGSDGLLYVMSTGDYFSGEGRLSVVDPLAGTEVASFAGFGTGPGNVAADADARIFVSSYSQGVMEFNLDSNKVVRGAGNGVPIPSNATVAVDSKGRVYAIDTGPCSGGQVGTAHVLDAKLEETATISLGECPVGSAVVQIPPE
jgi:hypothetical protein